MLLEKKQQNCTQRFKETFTDQQLANNADKNPSEEDIGIPHINSRSQKTGSPHTKGLLVMEAA